MNYELAGEVMKRQKNVITCSQKEIPEEIRQHTEIIPLPAVKRFPTKVRKCSSFLVPHEPKEPFVTENSL